MTTDDPVRTHQRLDVNIGVTDSAPELCAQCDASPPANGTYWCSDSCMRDWTAAATAVPGAWPTPGYTETAHAGTKTVGHDPWAWLDTNLPTGPLPHAD
jgi:hypothetical protein